MVAAAVFAAGCLVVSVNPAYDSESIGFEPALIGTWQDTDDNASMTIEAGEWKSYRVHYVHPIETGDLTGYLTSIDDTRYLDLMPARGEDRGSFVVPVHAVVRVRLDRDTLELTPLSYDWFFDRLHARLGVPGLNVALDQKENALIVSPTSRLRDWLRRQPADGRMFGASAVFSRKR
ncbi:MAG TPA: hypothetical protein VF147_04005 [Vicinamibacterales bacterium]